MRTRSAIIAGAALGLLATAGPAEGGTREPPLTSGNEVKCQREVGRDVGKLFDDSLRAWAKCFAGEGIGRGDCTAIDIAAREAKVRAKIVRRCSGLADFSILGLGASLNDALDVLLPRAEQQAADVASLVYENTYGAGENLLMETDPALFVCLRWVGQRSRKIARAHVRENSRCFYQDDRQQVKDPSRLPRCDDSRRAARISQLDSREAQHIADFCTAEQILSATGESDAAALVSAIASRIDCAVCDAYPRAGNRNPCPARCPLTLQLRTLGGTADVGWTGDGHGTSIAESGPGTVQLFNCSGDGVKTCQIFAATNGVTTLVAPSGEAPLLAAAVTSFATDLTGSITFTGALDSVEHMELSAEQKVDIFLVGQPENFPLCAGGAAPGEAGTCSAGPNQNKACTVAAIFPIGPTSPDCPPSPGNHPGYMSIAATLVSAPVTLDSTIPCGPGGIFLCHCAGQTQPNNCPVDGVCSPDGTCSANPAHLCFPPTITRMGSTVPLVMAAVGCADGSGPALKSVVGLPGPFAITQQMEVAFP